MSSIFQVVCAEGLLIAGASPNVERLYWCVSYSPRKVTELLIKYGADLNACGYYYKTALHLCAERGLTKMAETLLEAGADPEVEDLEGCTPLMLALFRENIKMVEVLAKHIGQDMECPTRSDVQGFFYFFPTNANSAQHLEILLDNGLDKKDICLADLYGLYELLEVLIQAGCDPNKIGRRGEAILNHMMQKGFRCGASEPLVPEEELPTRDSLCQMLIEAGADVDLPNTSGVTPLETAVIHSNTTGARQLLQANCDINVTSNVGGKAAEFMAEAVKENAKDCATFILGNGCGSKDQQFFMDLSHQPEAMVGGKTVGLSTPPTSLFRLCRLAIRATLPKGPSFLTAVEELPLPVRIRDFVALRLSCSVPDITSLQL